LKRFLLFLAVLLGAALSGCHRQAAIVAPGAHYIVGQGYQMNGVWFYPREDFHYSETGLAVVEPDRQGITADGEAIDPSALTASHQTLQLPAIAVVTDLENGLQIRVRVNDRGPDTPKRLIGLSRRAGELLRIPPGAAVPVRVEVDEGMSTALRDQLNGGVKLELTAAPRGAVTAEALAPPPGVQQSARGANASTAKVASVDGGGAEKLVPDRLPEVVVQSPVGFTRLAIHAGVFGRMEYARQIAARLFGIGARVERMRTGRSEQYAVVAGPFTTVGEADTALDQAMRAGVTDARIVVE
jgi:rare lipoprotein A